MKNATKMEQLDTSSKGKSTLVKNRMSELKRELQRLDKELPKHERMKLYTSLSSIVMRSVQTNEGIQYLA